MKYYLVGYMYCGKSTFGRRLAEAKGMDYLDLDRAFEARYHYTVPMFFQRFGEAAFRTLETQMLHSTADLDNVVIATGGGTPCYGDNMDFILAHGTAVYLQMPVDALVERALRSRNPRPHARTPRTRDACPHRAAVERKGAHLPEGSPDCRWDKS